MPKVKKLLKNTVGLLPNIPSELKALCTTLGEQTRKEAKKLDILTKKYKAQQAKIEQKQKMTQKKLIELTKKLKKKSTPTAKKQLAKIKKDLMKIVKELAANTKHLAEMQKCTQVVKAKLAEITNAKKFLGSLATEWKKKQTTKTKAKRKIKSKTTHARSKNRRKPKATDIIERPNEPASLSDFEESLLSPTRFGSESQEDLDKEDDTRFGTRF